MSKKLVELPYGKVRNASFKIIQGLGDVGGTEETVKRINSDQGYVDQIVKAVITGGYEPSTGHVRARQIMGKNFFGPDDAMKHFGVQATRRQLAALSEIPFSEETLIACKNTHILIAVPSASILEIRELVSKLKLPKGQKAFFYSQDWYNGEAFAKEKGQVGWYLVRKTPVDNSTGKNWDEQQALLGKDEETPSAQVMVYTIIAYFLATGERLFEGVYVRCSDLDSGGNRVCVGFFIAVWFILDGCWGSSRSVSIGGSSARK